MPYIYAASDIHGFAKPLSKALPQIDLSDRANRLILCGDYIDYGPDSCKTLYQIKRLQEKNPGQVIVLMGNHETMFLEFLDADFDDFWNAEWIQTDVNQVTTSSFISEPCQKQIGQIRSNADTYAYFTQFFSCQTSGFIIPHILKYA